MSSKVICQQTLKTKSCVQFLAPYPSSWAMVCKSQVLHAADPQLYNMESNTWSLYTLAPARSSGKSFLLSTCASSFCCNFKAFQDTGQESMKNSLNCSNSLMVYVYEKVKVTKGMCCSQRPRDLAALYHFRKTWHSAMQQRPMLTSLFYLIPVIISLRLDQAICKFNFKNFICEYRKPC